MIERISGLPEGIDGIRCAGKLTREEYDTVVLPIVDDALRQDRRLRVLVEITGFDGITPSAAFEDINLGLRALSSWAGCAVVTDVAWIGNVMPFTAFLMPFPVHRFPTADRERAVQWLTDLPTGASLTHHLRFVLAHHRRVEKVALAVDGTMASIGAAVASRVLHAEVRRFPATDVDAAIAWASGAA